MTLDEAIKHAEEVAESNEKSCEILGVDNTLTRSWKKYAKEHRQLAEWLKELKQLRKQTDGDLISRQDAEGIFREARRQLKPQDYKTAYEFNTRDLMLLNAEQLIHQLPPVTPQPSAEKTAEWEFPQSRCAKCSYCGHIIYETIYRYCPNCGAKMKGYKK